LSGPAGTGKTTVAHTIADEYHKRGRLAASFFFWRKTGDRDDINKLVATLAYQIAERISSAKEVMEGNLGLRTETLEPLTVIRDRLSKISLEDRLSKLLISRSDPALPNLLVIDGLDECSSREGICRMIEWIRKNRFPFRFLLTSRPEPDIKVRFTSGPHTDVRALSLTESEADIRKYFVEQLERVWPAHQRIEERGPSEWPSGSDLNRLVEKSEGLFVYAATAVRYIGDSEDYYPLKRLREVLTLHKGLDYLYVQVIEEAKKHKFFDIVMGCILYIRYPLSLDDLSGILLPLDKHLTASGILSSLRRCHSILAIAEGRTIDPYHASLRDFLTDESRASTLFLAPATFHGRLMLACFSAITRAFSNGNPGEYAFLSWYYHACIFLTSSGGDGEGLGEMRNKVEELVKKIDLNWVKSWMSEALLWAGIPYFRVKLPHKKVQE
jgi:hypothetical protein